MNSNDFADNVRATLDEIDARLIAKGAEYVPTDAQSRFHNFDKGAAFQNTTPALALRGYLTKHIVSLYDMLDRPDTTDVGLEQWDEKILDIMTYLAILRAMVGYEAERSLPNIVFTEVPPGTFPPGHLETLPTADTL